MQRIISVMLALLVLAFTATGQDFYVRGGLGYATYMAGQTMDGTATPYGGSMNNSSTTSTDYVSYSLKKASYAAGVHLFLAGGYMFTPNIGFDLALDINAKPAKYTYSDNNISVPIGNSSITENLTITQHAKTPVLAIPALVMQTNGKKMNLYSRIGLALPLGTKIIQDQLFNNPPGAGAPEPIDYTYEIQNTFTIGLSAALGIQYPLSDRVCLWGEMNFLSMSLFTKQATLTNVTDSGYNVLNQVPDSQKVVHFSKNFTAQQGDYYHQPAFAQPFSNIGFTFGVKVNITSNGHNAAHRRTGKNYDDNDNY